MKQLGIMFSLLLVCGALMACKKGTASVDKKPEKITNPVIAHRGAWKADKLPQNSIAALRKAIELRCYGSEFDVHLTKDDILVVNHDHEFFGLDIENSTYQQLLSKKHANGETIPTARAYLLEGMKQTGTKLIFELKESKLGKARTLKAAEESVKLVKELKAENFVEYISFDYDALKKMLEVDPKAKVAYLNGNTVPQQLKDDGLSGLDYHISFYKKFTTWIIDAHQMGLTVNVWTVNTKEDMNYFINQGADYITTDEPELLHYLWQQK